MGNGVHGHLGLDLKVAEYVNITPTSYARPVHPVILNISMGMPNYEATRLTDQHKELVRLTRETNNVEKCRLKQFS